jgi:hypothetical protein
LCLQLKEDSRDHYADLGLHWGAIWWILGPLLIMPAMMGMPLFTIDGMSPMSLLGHLIYGAVAGAAYAWYAARP